MCQHFCLTGRIIRFSYYSTYKTKILPHQPLNGSLKYWIFFSLLFCLWGKNVATSTHLKADVGTFLSYRQNNRKKNFNILMTHWKADVGTFFPHRQNNREKYWFFFSLLFHLQDKNFTTSAFKWVIKILKFFFPIILSVRKKCCHISL
jgi:hypothetical protein